MAGNKRVISILATKALFAEHLYCLTLPLIAGYGTIIYVDKNVPGGSISEKFLLPQSFEYLPRPISDPFSHQSKVSSLSVYKRYASRNLIDEIFQVEST
jgi:hypothetical protein